MLRTEPWSPPAFSGRRRSGQPRRLEGAAGAWEGNRKAWGEGGSGEESSHPSQMLLSHQERKNKQTKTHRYRQEHCGYQREGSGGVGGGKGWVVGGW